MNTIDVLISTIIISILAYGVFRFIQEIIKDERVIKDSKTRTAAAIKQMEAYDKEAKAMAEFYSDIAADPDCFKELNELLTNSRIEH